VNSQHTPGPWIEQGSGTVAHPVSGGVITTTRIETTLGNIEIIDETNEQAANALLIASAPELLNALELMVNEFKLPFLEVLVTHHVLVKARAAIRKAKGEA